MADPLSYIGMKIEKKRVEQEKETVEQAKTLAEQERSVVEQEKVLAEQQRDSARIDALEEAALEIEKTAPVSAKKIRQLKNQR